MAIKAMDLFEAYTKDNLPKDQAYIASTHINGNTGYSIYEVICYSAVKTIYPEGGGLTFQSSGKKLHILIEPPSYPNKAIEPYLRDTEDRIPLRFNELDLHTTKNQARIYMAKNVQESLSSFSIAKPSGLNVSILFYNEPDIYDTMGKFFEQSFNKDAGINQTDAKKASTFVIEIAKKQMSFKGDFD